MAEDEIWQILVVDDDEEACQQIKEYLQAETVNNGNEAPVVITTTDFDEAIVILAARKIDLVVIDIKQEKGKKTDESAGIKIFNSIKSTRFVPIIFYTGLPKLVKDLVSPFIRVVEKTEGLEKLLYEVRQVFATQLPLISRALHAHIEESQRDYMWTYVAENWAAFGATPDKYSLAYLLARRLAMSFSDENIRKFAQAIGMQSETKITEGLIHSMQYYVIPPMSTFPLTGDLYSGEINGTRAFWVLLTPTCDLLDEHPKAENVLFAQCLALEEQPEYQAWIKEKEKNREKLRQLLTNTRRQKDRHFFLPAALSIPNLLVDFQKLMTTPFGNLELLTRLASLDSPFAEGLAARYARYIGRVGTPDLDMDHLIDNL